MAELELRQKHCKRGTLKQQLTLFDKFISSITKIKSNDEFQNLSKRMEKIEPLFASFNELQSEIEFLTIQDEQGYASECGEREPFQDSYFSLVSKAHKLLKEYQPDSDMSVDSLSMAVSQHSQKTHVKLPPVNLPIFEGNFTEWRTFFDSFNSLIHLNEDLSPVQKLTYLKSSLKGEPHLLISTLKTTELNYSIAWNLLIKRYDNKRRIVNSHVHAILNLETVTRNSPAQLRDFLNNIVGQINCLRSLDQPVSEWNALLVPIITSKLNMQTESEWESRITVECPDITIIPSLDNLINFLTNKLNTLEILISKRPDRVKHSQQKGTNTQRSFAVVESKPNTCLLCKKSHFLYQCSEFLKLSNTQRNEKVRELKICINCMRKGHFVNDCKSNHNCKKCSRKHNTLLHLDRAADTSAEASGSSSHSSQSPPVETLTGCSSINYATNVLLSTAIVKIKDARNKFHKVRALLDSASQSNFITESLCKQLQLRRNTINMQVHGIGHGSLNISESTNISFQSVHNNFSENLKCLIVNQITNSLPQTTFDKTSIEIPPNITLADPTFYESGPIDLLIGAGIFWSLISVGQIKLDRVVIQKTKLGYILSGEIYNNQPSKESLSCLSFDTLNSNVERFWHLDEFTTKPQSLTPDEQHCENYFNETTKRDDHGKFIVKIPFTSNLTSIGCSFNSAESQFKSLERRFQQNLDLKLEYSKFIKEYALLGHMTKITSPINPNDNSAFYLPHHAVIKTSSDTTKLRVVFNGSAKPLDGLSINEVQHAGPTLQNEIFSIIARFRQHKYVLTGDIEKMYRQVWICPSQRQYQRILWRDDPSESVSQYNLNTITYGLKSAPYLAIRCLMQVAVNNRDQYPNESKIIYDDFFVDDLITGSDNLQQLELIKTNLINMLKDAGFHLRKFKSNVPELCDLDSSNSQFLQLTDHEHKTLGILWNSFQDLFIFSFPSLSSHVESTKRTILSETAKLYDPLGLLAPIIIIAKLIIQSLWQLNIGWDESVPMALFTQWAKFKELLPHVNKLCIPRRVFIENHTRIELHVFADASQKAYGAAIYLKSTNNDDACTVRLLAAKSRVAPLKTISVPRLELCAAVLAAQLSAKFKSILTIKIDAEFYWCDSEITLCWIKSHATRWKTFVANRVAEIQTLTNPWNWHHVKSDDNPADLISRGVLPNQLAHANLWWSGPQWLQNDFHNYPSNSINIHTDELPEIKSKIVNNVQLTFQTCIEDSFPMSDYSSLNKLQRITAYCLRFKHNSQNPTARRCGPLNTSELSLALERLVKLFQITSFSRDYQTLKENKILHPKSHLLSLTPFLDSNGIMRVGGRLKLSNLNYDKKHPILLPKQNHFTQLLFRQEHERLLHAGPTLLLSCIRERFWPISGKNVAKKIVKNCIKCFKFNCKPVNQLMGELPTERTRQMYPFHSTGLDYAGPYSMKYGAGRGHKVTKCYICLFICFATKAVHLELVSDLSTKMFLIAFKRFIARRGKPSKLFSDNGTNFVGANNELKALGEFLMNNADSLASALSSEGVDWRFIPPRSPNFGGFWEAGIKSIKNHLKRILTNVPLTYEEFSTILTQIESVLNSRPLTPLSSDPNDPEVLTPAHFLIGRTFVTIPDPDVTDIPQGRLTRYQLLQRLNVQFWNKWSKDYLQQLQRRTKWKTLGITIEPGMMVIIKHDHLPPAQWRLGRITTLHPGKDNITRVVSVKCASGDVKVPINKICVLPLKID